MMTNATQELLGNVINMKEVKGDINAASLAVSQ